MNLEICQVPDWSLEGRRLHRTHTGLERVLDFANTSATGKSSIKDRRHSFVQLCIAVTVGLLLKASPLSNLDRRFSDLRGSDRDST